MNKIKGIHSIFSKVYTSITPCKKRKSKKIFLIPYSTPDKLSYDTSLNCPRWIYRSAKIDGTKKPIWVYSSSPPPPQEGSEQKYLRNIQQNYFQYNRQFDDMLDTAAVWLNRSLISWWKEQKITFFKNQKLKSQSILYLLLSLISQDSQINFDNIVLSWYVS